MRGFLSIEREAARWSRADTDAYLVVAAVGVLAGIVVAYARMPLHMPGHKALWWMIPVLASRLLTRTRAGASTGAFATVITTLSLGGRLAGGVAMMPLVIVAGVVLDWAAGFVERHHVPRWGGIVFLALAGTVGNLVCFAKWLFESKGAVLWTGNMGDLVPAAGSYAFFGFLAGLVGAAAAFFVLTVRASHTAR